MRRSRKIALTFGLMLAGKAWAADTSLPLFQIERSTNANVIRYDARLGPDGKIDSDHPVAAYWIMAAANGSHQPLTALEKARAYGFSTRYDGAANAFFLTLVSDPQRKIRIYLKDGAARAETAVGSCRNAFLRRIFVTTRKSTWFNVPVSLELYGSDVASGEPCYEKIFRDR